MVIDAEELFKIEAYLFVPLFPQPKKVVKWTQRTVIMHNKSQNQFRILL